MGVDELFEKVMFTTGMMFLFTANCGLAYFLYWLVAGETRMCTDRFGNPHLRKPSESYVVEGK